MASARKKLERKEKNVCTDIFNDNYDDDNDDDCDSEKSFGGGESENDKERINGG